MIGNSGGMLGDMKKVDPKKKKDKDGGVFARIQAFLGSVKKDIKDKGEEFGRKRGIGTRQYPHQ